MPGQEQSATRQTTGQQTITMPHVMGMPWVQRFGGLESELKFGECQEQIETMLSFQPINDAQKVDMIMGFLDGEAKREILTLGRAERNTPNKILLYCLSCMVTPLMYPC